MKSSEILKLSLALTMLIPLPCGLLTASDSDKEWTMATKMYSDRKAKAVGDLITVLIEETSTATKDGKTTSSKQNSLSGSLSFGHPKMDDRPTAWTNMSLPSYALDTKGSFQGAGSIQNNDKFVTKITAKVMEVLPNGNMLIEGKRMITLQQETVEMVLTGVIRPNDVAKDNTIQSSSIADAAIRYSSSGPIAREQERGLLMSFWNWVNPF